MEWQALSNLNGRFERRHCELPVYRQQNFKTREDKAEYLEELIEERLKILRAADEGLIHWLNTSKSLKTIPISLWLRN